MNAYTLGKWNADTSVLECYDQVLKLESSPPGEDYVFHWIVRGQTVQQALLDFIVYVRYITFNHQNYANDTQQIAALNTMSSLAKTHEYLHEQKFSQHYKDLQSEFGGDYKEHFASFIGKHATQNGLAYIPNNTTVQQQAAAVRNNPDQLNTLCQSVYNAAIQDYLKWVLDPRTAFINNNPNSDIKGNKKDVDGLVAGVTWDQRNLDKPKGAFAFYHSEQQPAGTDDAIGSMCLDMSENGTQYPGWSVSQTTGLHTRIPNVGDAARPTSHLAICRSR